MRTSAVTWFNAALHLVNDIGCRVSLEHDLEHGLGFDMALKHDLEHNRCKALLKRLKSDTA